MWRLAALSRPHIYITLSALIKSEMEFKILFKNNYSSLLKRCLGHESEVMKCIES
jgi:hypothetical protein